MTRFAMLIVAIFIFGAGDSFGQWSQPGGYPNQPQPMYDMSYKGPMNIYGQPVYSMEPRKDEGQGAQNANDGVFPMAATGLGALGSYLWSYMPAPVRGEPQQFGPPPGSGYVVRQVVPGSN
jgi:hypothetical protein